MKLNELTIKQAREKLDNGEITSVKLTQACFDRIEEVDGKIKACLALCREQALKDAKLADDRIKGGEKGSLLGIPFLAKDILMTKGMITTASSKMLEEYIAPYNATVITKLKEAGAILLGKTNLDEFAHGASTENSAFNPTHNPWDLERVPGGSSGGSAAAVVADMCIFSLGTDTGGSVRQPASFCNIVGLKPSYGRSSRFGLMSMTSSTDVVGPLTKTVEDSSLVLEVISGKDSNDATTTEEKVPEYSKGLKKDLKGIKIGLPEEYFTEDLNKDVKLIMNDAIEKLKELGAKIVNISLPHTKYSVPTYYIITPSEISSNLARLDGIRYGLSDDAAKNLSETYLKNRGKGFGSETKRRIMLGTYVLSAGYYDAYYLKAQKTRVKIKEELIEALKKVDVIMTPTSPHTAFKIGEQVNNPVQMYLEDIFLSSASLAGLPAISVPAGFIQDLPIGMQLIGKMFDEEGILRVGYSYEQSTDWNSKKPSI